MKLRAGGARLMEAFLDMMSAERGASVNTLAAYRRDLLDFHGFLAGRGIDARRAARDDLKTLSCETLDGGIAGSSQARRLSALRQFFGFLYAEGIRADDPPMPSMRPNVAGPCRKSCREKTWRC